MLFSLSRKFVACQLLTPKTKFISKNIKNRFAKFSEPINKDEIPKAKTKEQQKSEDFDILGTWDNRIELPLLLQQSIKRGKPIPKISVENAGFASVTGRRTTNEDRYRIKELLPNLLYLAVFDGHGGPVCADYCCENMERHILYWINQGETDFNIVLHNSFIELNNAFARYVTFSGTENPNSPSGTTATVCLLWNSTELYVANAGDSVAILCRNNKAQRLTADHSPAIKTEKERIFKSKGTITFDQFGKGLVNGRLAMTRSLGDLELKPFGVISMPDIKNIEVSHGKDAFIILTTDGINNVMSDKEVTDAVVHCNSPMEGAQFVTDQALQFASDDNATALILPFGAWGKFRAVRNVSFFGRGMSHGRWS